MTHPIAHTTGRLSAALLGLLLIAGCATSQPVAPSPEIRIERIDSQTARIVRTYLTEGRDGVVVRGELTHMTPARGAIPGYLHVELLDQAGRVFKQADIGYLRNNVTSQRSSFHLTLPKGAEVSGIRIRHVDAREHDTAHDGVWQEIDPR